MPHVSDEGRTEPWFRAAQGRLAATVHADDRDAKPLTLSPTPRDVSMQNGTGAEHQPTKP